MYTFRTATRICEAGVVAVVRAESAEQASKIVDACVEGGILGIEITFTVPDADLVLREVARKYKGSDVLLGAGTVLDPETARIAILAGAQYVISATCNPDTARLCNRYQVPYLPGCTSVAEIVQAMELGAPIIKLFPGDTLGPGFVKAVRGPLPHAPLMPSGGVSVANAAEWIKAGCVAVSAGGALTAGAKTGDYASITRIAGELVAQVRAARGK